MLLGSLGSLCFGVGDFLGGEGARRIPPTQLVIWAGAVSLPPLIVLAALVGGRPSAADMWFGAAAGVSGAFGLVLLFAGLSKGRAAVVAPSAAALSAVVPVTVGLLAGDSLSTVTWMGIGLAIPGIVLSSSGPEDAGEAGRGGLGFGVAAGVLFAGYVVFIDVTSEASGMVPLVPARASGVVALALASLGSSRARTTLRQIPWLIVVGVALLDAGGNVALLAGLRIGPLAPVAVAASFYPAVTVIMAGLVNAEIPARRQMVGVAVTIGAVTAIGLG